MNLFMNQAPWGHSTASGKLTSLGPYLLNSWDCDEQWENTGAGDV